MMNQDRIARILRSSGVRTGQPSKAPRLITAKFDGSCTECPVPVRAGETVHYTPGRRGVQHVGCGE